MSHLSCSEWVTLARPLAMAGTDNANHDYSVRTPRSHHSLYIEDGNLVIQVII